MSLIYVFNMTKASKWRSHVCVNKDRLGYTVVTGNSKISVTCTKQDLFLTLTKSSAGWKGRALPLILQLSYLGPQGKQELT